MAPEAYALQIGHDHLIPSMRSHATSMQQHASVEVTCRQGRGALCHVDLLAGQLPKIVVFIHLYISAVLQAVHSGACLAARGARLKYLVMHALFPAFVIFLC